MSKSCIVSHFTFMIRLYHFEVRSVETRNTHCEHGCLARMQTMSRARSAEQMADKVVTVRTDVESFSFTFMFPLTFERCKCIYSLRLD